jgi:hypothetical protein
MIYFKILGITNTFLFNKQNCKVYTPSFPPREQYSPTITKGTNKTNLIYFIEIKLLTYSRRSIFLTKQKSNN